MNWENLNLHLENLLPGLVTLPLLLRLFGESLLVSELDSSSWLVSSEVVRAGIAIAASYLIGIVAVIISRIVIDFASGLLPRPLFLYFSRRRPPGPWREMSRQFNAAVGAALANAPEAIKTEVVKRRERSRLLRTCFVPVVLAVWILTAGQEKWVRLALEFASFIIIVLLYAYTEVMIYQEATLPSGSVEERGGA